MNSPRNQQNCVSVTSGHSKRITIRLILQNKTTTLTISEPYFTGSNARLGLETITNYKGKHSHELLGDANLPDELNNFYAHFEASNTEACMGASAVPDDCVITLSVASMNE